MKSNPLRLILGSLTVCALVLFAACAKKPPTTAEKAQPTPAPTTAPVRQVTQPPAPPRETVVKTPLDDTLAEMNAKGYLKDAYFDYDKADLREDARATLAANADWLKNYRSVQILIEGHCDERGTSAYNLALGDRRANAARDYLASLGVDASRMKTVSYGKERPICTESNEGCWQRNRRAAFVITAK